MVRCPVLIAMLVAPIFMLNAQAASVNDLSPSVKTETQCMLKTLSTIPGVSNAKLKIFTSGAKVYPQLEYQFVNKSGEKQIVIFGPMTSSFANSKGYAFMAELPGLFSPQAPLNDWGTNLVMKTWKNQCGVNADVLYE